MDDGADELQVCGLTLRGITRGGIQTCLMVPELDVMFDVGGFARGALRYGRILVSHGHQDHLGGLPYLVSQRHLVGNGPATIHVPIEIEAPLRQILAAWETIEDFRFEAELVGHRPEDRIGLPRNCEAVALRSVHRVPSLCWLIERTTEKLRPEFVGLSGPEIQTRRAAGESVTVPESAPLLCVTGDTQIELFLSEPRVRSCRVLVHEVTAWDDRRDVDDTRRWGHTHVDELIEHAERFEGEALVLVHRSPRHTRSEAERVVRQRFPAAIRKKVHVFGR